MAFIQTNRMMLRVYMLVILSGIAACTDDQGSEEAAPEVGSSGKGAIVQIGAVEGPEEFVFGRIVGVATDPAGNVYVLDEQVSNLRAYSSSGDFIKVVAREGDGPGEVRRPMGLNLGQDGRLYVREAKGVSVFAPDPVTSVRDSLVETFRGPAYPSFDSRRGEATNRAYYYPFYDFPREGTERFFFIRYGEDRTPTDTLEVPPFRNLSSRRRAFVRLSASGGRAFQGLNVVPFERRAVFDVTPRGTIVGGDGTDYTLVEVDSDGDTLLTIRGGHAPEEVDPVERADSADALAERLDSMPVPLDRVENLSTWIERGDLPTSYPPYIDVWSGADGSTWVRRWPPRSGGEHFDVYTEDGSLRGSIHLPIDIDRTVPPHFSAETVVAVVKDPTTDVQLVVVLPMELE